MIEGPGVIPAFAPTPQFWFPITVCIKKPVPCRHRQRTKYLAILAIIFTAWTGATTRILGLVVSLNWMHAHALSVVRLINGAFGLKVDLNSNYWFTQEYI